MKKSILAGAGIVSVAVGLLAAASAYAATPTLSLAGVGGDSVQVSVNGDPNASVAFYNPTSALGTQVTTLGSTNANGFFQTTITGSSYGITSGSSVYVIVNGQQSATQAWPNTASGGTPVLSQGSITVGLGQTLTVTSQTNTNIYMAINSNPAIAFINTNGTQIAVRGTQIGTTVASICYVGTSSNCANLSVTVQATGVSAVSFSQNNVSLAVGSNQSVTVTGGNGTYSISANSNVSAVSTNLSGSALTVSALAAGNATITVCDSVGSCGPLSVTVGSSVSNQAVTFGVTNPTLTVGQTLNVGLSGGSGYFLLSNANAGVAQASVNGTSLALLGAAAGTDSVTVCVAGGGCSPLSITVTNSAAGTTGTTTTSTTTAAVTQAPVTNAALLAEIKTMQSAMAQIITLMQSFQNQFAQLVAQVSAGSGVGISTSVNTTHETSHTFIKFLTVGSHDNEVSDLQQRLTELKFYSGDITGFYGSLTESAVREYQKAHGIDPAGYVGPSTRAALNGGD